jgi:hypothetical protein
MKMRREPIPKHLVAYMNKYRAKYFLFMINLILNLIYKAMKDIFLIKTSDIDCEIMYMFCDISLD